MSTDIVHWTSNARIYQSAALKTYLYVSVPFTFAVLAFWGAMQLYEKEKEDKKARAEEGKLKHPEP